MRSLEQSKQRWQVVTRHAVNLEHLKKAVKLDDDNPCTSGLRSVCWKIFLLFQSTDVTGWSQALENSRSAYTSLRGHLLRYIENPDELGSAIDPLDDDQNSPWNTARQDEEIRAEIFQDVERCMPEDPYFRKPETQRVLLDILFVFCKINQDVGYRQGMHELLAPILWVVEQDAIDYGNQGPKGNSQADSLIKDMLDRNFIEHDAFTLLSLIMRSAKSFYELGEPDLRSNTSSTGSGTPQHGASPIVERSKRIHEVYLARLDPALSKHLTEIEVLPQIFLIRWIRLLFGREFPFDELLKLWDTLFTEDPGLELIDLVCVAMLLRIRWQLIEANYSMALMLLLKYPSPESPNEPRTFVSDATYLRDNFSALGGSEVISKYSGKSPPQFLDSRPETPLAHTTSPKRIFARTKSPLPSPARFLQQQGGVEALFQGAARGVFDRAERLGINQAVRDAVGEAKKNMQGLQVSRSNSTNQKSSDLMRWSLDEGRSIPSSKAAIMAMNARNKQLAKMLDQVMTDLRTVSTSHDGNKEKYTAAMDVAIAKVDFVKVYLEDSTIPLPEEPQSETSANPQALEQDSLQAKIEDGTTASSPISNNPAPQSMQGNPSLEPGPPEVDPSAKVLQVQSSSEPIPIVDVPKASGQPIEAAITARPKAPVPTRSTIAQSSFSWMLEPDTPTPSSHKSSPLNASSPFLKSGRRPNSGPNREKAAFLFGDDGGEASLPKPRLPLLDNTDETFNLGTMGVPKPR